VFNWRMIGFFELKSPYERRHKMVSLSKKEEKTTFRKRCKNPTRIQTLNKLHQKLLHILIVWIQARPIFVTIYIF